MARQLEEGDIVMCTVESISGTIVFVKIDETGQQGSIVFSEVAPGRIRNIRAHVVPNKKIVCKVLRVKGDKIDLSLRRVRPNEEKELKQRYKQEIKIKNALKGLLGKENAEKIIKKIETKDNLFEFLQEKTKNLKEIEKLLGKENAEKITKLIDSQSNKKAIIKKQIFLTSKEPNGLELIKNLFKDTKDIEVKYISSGKYSLKIIRNNIKKADKEIKAYLENLEKKAKKSKIEFKIEKNK